MNYLQILFSTLVEKCKGAYEAVQDRIKYGSTGSGMSISAQGVREAINRHPAMFGGVVGVLVLGGAIYAFSDMFTSAGDHPMMHAPTQWYYSDDDGATFFADDVNKTTPFDKDGRPAVRAHVFSCDGGSHNFVGYLERQTAQAKTDLAAIPPIALKANPTAATDVLLRDREVKKPMTPEKEWAGPMKKEFNAIVLVHCPDGKGDMLGEVFP